MNTLNIRPERSGASMSLKGANTTVRFGPGKLLSRFTGPRATREMALTWICTRLEYQYFRAFYRTTSLEGSRAFKIRSGIPGIPNADQACRFVPGSFVLQSQTGSAYVVNASVILI